VQNGVSFSTWSILSLTRELGVGPRPRPAHRAAQERGNRVDQGALWGQEV